MAKICISTTTEYIGYVASSQDGERHVYSNGLWLTKMASTSSLGYRLDFDTDQNEYVLSKYSAELGSLENLNVLEQGIVEIASFNIATQEFSILAKAEIINIGNVRSSEQLLSVFKFIKIAYENAQNKISGAKVWELFKKSCIHSTHAYKNMLLFYDNMECLEKLGVSMFFMIGQENFKIDTEANERHKLFNIPKQVLNYIENDSEKNSYKKERYIECFKKIKSSDPNELIAIIDYFKLYDEITKKISHKSRSKSYGSSIGEGDKCSLIYWFSEIKEMHPEIDLRKLLKYLIKQQFWRQHSENDYVDCARFALEIPSVLARIYYDYLNLGATDLFPQHLYKSHNILSIEAHVEFTDEEKLRFEKYGIALGKELNRDINEFSFVVPSNYDEFVRIGKTFQNCLPTCGESFYRGLCDIVFIYSAEEDTPKYAIELNKEGLLVQAKTTRDLDISDEDVLMAIETFEKQIVKERKERNKENGAA